MTPTLVEGLRLMYADEHERAREALQRAHAVGASRGDDPAQTEALLFLAELECRAGDWSRADEYAEELLQVAEQQGLEFQGGSALWIRGLVDAYLGRLDEARARATEGVVALARGGRAGLPRAEPRAARPDRPVHRRPPRGGGDGWLPVVRRRQARGAGEPSLYPARELAIEALVAIGDLDEARVQLDWLEEAGRRLGTPWPLAMGARCRGLLLAAEGDLEAALASCERALEVHERMPGAVRARPHPARSTARSFAGPSGGRPRGRRSRRRSRSSRPCRRRSGPTTRARSWRGSAAVRRRATG